MKALESAWGFINQAVRTNSVRDYQNLFSRMVSPLSIDRFSFIQATGPDRTLCAPKVLFGQGHEAWYKYYTANKLYLADPILKYLLDNPSSLLLSELPEQNLTQAAKRVRLAAVEAGEKNGVIVPVEGTKGELFLSRMTTPHADISPQSREILQALGLLYAVIGVNKFTKSKDILRPKPLSRREAECLGWVSEGKSDWDISEILGISKHTVHEHLERAKAKLQARTRTQAAVLATSNGWLVNPSDKGTRPRC